MGFVLLLIILGIIILSSIRQIDEYERGILFQFGKFKKALNPGWNIVLPIIQSFKKVDIRTKVTDVPEQDAITKDNVSVKINAVLYFKIFDASKAIIAVENYHYAVSQLAQTTMRNAVGSVTLDDLLSERDKISAEISSKDTIFLFIAGFPFLFFKSVGVNTSIFGERNLMYAEVTKKLNIL